MGKASGVSAVAVAALLAIAGCGGGGRTLTGAAGSGGGGAAGGAGTSDAGMPPRLFLRDVNNYAATTSLTIPAVQTASGADLRICWNGLAKDLSCHDLVAATDIDNVSFLLMPNVSQSQVAEALALGQLDENTINVYQEYYTDQAPASTCANLSQFKFGSEFLVPASEYVANPNRTYMLLFTTGTRPGVGARAMLFLEPTATSSVTAVDAVDMCAAGAFSLAVTLGQPLPIASMDRTLWHLDWSQITRDSSGSAVNFGRLDSVQVGFYQNLTTADLQARFIDIDLIATSRYVLQIAPGARDVDLAAAVREGTGEAFPGFTRSDGVWTVALRCSRCQVDRPVVLSILQILMAE